jgi:hypothetical protein
MAREELLLEISSDKTIKVIHDIENQYNRLLHNQISLYCCLHKIR